MTKSSYREQDYVFGQLMLTLRMASGLTQAGLADHLGVSRNAVGGWEIGQSYPTAEHLKAFIVLGLRASVFAAGREAEEIRALWRAAHQKVLLDELWLQEVLSQQASPRMDVAGEQTPGADRVSALPASGEPRVDWGEALLQLYSSVQITVVLQIASPIVLQRGRTLSSSLSFSEFNDAPLMAPQNQRSQA